MNASAIRSEILLGVAGTAGVIALWESAARLGIVDPRIFPGPLMAVADAAQRLSPEGLIQNVGWSLYRVVTGFGLGALAGTMIGIAAGWYRSFGLIARPLIELLRPVPPLAWIPLAIIWFGLGEPSKFFIIFLGAFFPVVTAAYHGVSNVDPVLIRAAQTFGLKGFELLVRVVVPAASPDLATGYRIGWGLSFGVLVAAELIAADRGLGHMIMNARNTGEAVSVIVVGIMLIGLLNLVTDATLGGATQRWIGRWHGS
jgi:ABC-type nitrate/sulfonate/bicarbonate transport system permease component